MYIKIFVCIYTHDTGEKKIEKRGEREGNLRGERECEGKERARRERGRVHARKIPETESENVREKTRV